MELDWDEYLCYKQSAPPELAVCVRIIRSSGALMVCADICN